VTKRLKKRRSRRRQETDSVKIRGSNTALITPFSNGQVDDDAFKRLVEWQIAEGTHGLVPVGTTGESPTLSHEEHKHVIDLCIKTARGRVPVIAGTGSNATDEAIELSQFAEKAGADAVLIVTPYYNKPTQEGLYQHFKAINDALNIPIIIYNIPGRSVIDMKVDTMARLAKLKNIGGVKDSTADMQRASQQQLAMGPDFRHLTGEDASALGFMAHGGHGCISVISNIAPRKCAEFQNACMAGDFAQARRIHEQLMPLHDIMFIEANPGPVKHIAMRMGLCKGDMRLPLVPVSDEAAAKIDAVLERSGLLRAHAAE
jgi:4-hydroxy-tetrahydrodipicolinate synthase